MCGVLVSFSVLSLSHVVVVFMHHTERPTTWPQQKGCDDTQKGLKFRKKYTFMSCDTQRVQQRGSFYPRDGGAQAYLT